MLECTQARKHASDGSTLALKPRADVTKSQIKEYQWPHKKDLYPIKIINKNTRQNKTTKKNKPENKGQKPEMTFSIKI